jgi:hypothetical protein
MFQDTLPPSFQQYRSSLLKKSSRNRITRKAALLLFLTRENLCARMAGGNRIYILRQQGKGGEC